MHHRVNDDSPILHYSYRAVQWICVGLALWFTLSFVAVAILTMHYPFNLEWMEGQSIDVIQRIVDGKSVYVAPSIEYVPFLYTPYYYYVSAAIAFFTGVDFFPARLVSFLSTLGTGLILYAWVRKERGDRMSAFIAPGLFYSTYILSGRWFDIARIDSLFLCLTLAGLYVFTFYRGWQNALCAALLFTFGFYTKQSALLMIAPILAAGLYLDRRQAIMTIAMLGALLIGSIWFYDRATHGWFDFFVFRVPAGHDVDRKLIFGFWRDDLLRHVVPLLLVMLALLVSWWRADRKKALRYAALAVGCIGMAYAARLHRYGYINVLMPAHAALCLFAALALAKYNQWGKPGLQAVCGLAVAVQFLLLLYNPLQYIPTQDAIDKGNAFLREIAKYPGDIFMPDLEFVQTRAGKKSFAYGMAAVDIYRADLGEYTFVKDDLRDQIRHAIEQQRFGAIMQSHVIGVPYLNQYYVFDRHIDYPQEYIAGAINLMVPDMFVPIDKPPASTDDPASDKE